MNYESKLGADKSTSNHNIILCQMAMAEYVKVGVTPSSPFIFINFLRPRIGVKCLKVVWARAESLTWLKKMLSLASILITINLIFWNWFFCCIDTCVTSLGGMKKKLRISVDLDLLMSSDSLSFDRNFTSPTRCCSGSPELWSPQFTLNSLSKLIKRLNLETDTSATLLH